MPTQEAIPPEQPRGLPPAGAQTIPIEMGQPTLPEPMALPQEPPPIQTSVGPDLSTTPRHQSPVAENPVVAGLLASAGQFEARGDLARAAASIERGLRIQPRDPLLWQRLARIRLEQQRPEQAETTAKKSIALARGDRSIIAESWRIIAQARRQKGDTKGAALATEQARQYAQ